jgi:hypothetical protein
MQLYCNDTSKLGITTNGDISDIMNDTTLLFDRRLMGVKENINFLNTTNISGLGLDCGSLER